MRNMGWFLFVLVLFVNLCFNGCSSEPHLNNNNNIHPAFVVVGTVFCDTCSHQHLSKSPHFIPGAIVEVECKDQKTSKTNLKKQLKTNKHGNFKAVLALSVAKHTKTIQTCSVQLIKSSQPLCSVPASAISNSLKLKNSNTKNGFPLFSAGFFSFKPAFCARMTRPQLPFPPVIQPPSFLPPNPLMPAPLVPNPFQPPTPLIPNPFQPPAPAIPNPFQPLPPLPFFTPPSPPPSFVPPVLPPLIPIPGIPSGPPLPETSSPIKQSP